MNGSLFSITRYMNGVCFKVSGGTSVPKLPPSYPPPPPREMYTYIHATEWSFRAHDRLYVGSGKAL